MESLASAGGRKTGAQEMPRFVVQRTFADGLETPTTRVGAAGLSAIIINNAEESVTWVTSYVSTDRTKTFCVYDGPDGQAISRAAVANGLPVDSIAEVRVLDPYLYLESAS
jgi:hypothetical protein